MLFEIISDHFRLSNLKPLIDPNFYFRIFKNSNTNRTKAKQQINRKISKPKQINYTLIQ